MKTLKNFIPVLLMSFLFGNIIAKPYHFNFPKGVAFMIEIGPLSKELPKEIKDMFEFVDSQILPDGSLKYFAGVFTDYEKATIMENSLRFWGYGKTAVVAYFNTRNISVEDAVTLLGDKNAVDEAFVMGETGKAGVFQDEMGEIRKQAIFENDDIEIMAEAVSK